MRKILACGALLMFCCTVASLNAAQAAETGAALLTLQATVDPAKTPKPATFPHGEHQSRLECKTCHHGKGPDGKQTPYVEGQKIEQCESCHNTKTGMPEKVNTFKNAAHALCQECHKQNRPELIKCTVCHK